VSYLHEDEAAALEKRADRERCSKAEIIRRALRAYLGIED
jgi:Ribbon-helix-helix protein, copG family